MKKVRDIYIAYDIKDNKRRNRLAKRLQYYGLHRMQKSVFSGKIRDLDLRALMIEIERFAKDKYDSIHVLELCNSCKQKIIIYGNTPDIPRYYFF